uniref:Fumarylacetoacetate hydrolase domain-containing protein 1 n=1 Tax=Aegilops tauschii TaxID=37682 RepID=M8C6E6_AEGTA
MAAAAQRLLAASTKIVGVGRNYVAHAKELGNPVPKVHAPLPDRPPSDPEAPFLFLFFFFFPRGYALALDMTARDLQSVAKLLFIVGLCIFHFLVALETQKTEKVPKSAVPNPDDLELWLKVDDELRQKGPTSDMIFKVPFLISYISSIMTLMEGDVILTGTPEGVGPVRIGQKIKAGITGLIEAEFDVQRRSRTFSP